MFFGNPSWTSGSPAYLTPVDLYGHFDPLFAANWGMPVLDCKVYRIAVYGTGPPVIDPSAIGQFGIYDVSSGIPNNYALVAVSPEWPWPTGAPAQWWSVGCSIRLVSGTYALAIISWSAGASTGGVHFSAKVSAVSAKTFITPSVFPNPLGVPAGATAQNWAMVAEYVYEADACV